MNRIDAETRLKELFDEVHSIVEEVYGPNVTMTGGTTNTYRYFSVIKWDDDNETRRYLSTFDNLNNKWSENRSDVRNAALAENDELLEEAEADAS